MKHRLICFFALAMLWAGDIYATQCSDVFPGPQTFTTNSVESIESGVTCNGGTCSPGSFTAVSPFPSYSSSGNFSSSTIVGGTTYAHNSWNTSENQTVSFSGTGTVIIYIKNNATIKKGVKINVGGNPANVLMIFNRTLKIEENAVINAFIYVNGSETTIEKNSTISGGLAAKTKLTLKESSTYTYTPADADNIDASSFCEGSAPSVHHYEIEHDAVGSTCTNESVTVKACTDVSCSSLSTNSVSLDFQIDALTETSATFTGSTSVSISHLISETVTFSVANPSITPTNSLMCDSGSGTSCDMVFSSGSCQPIANWQMEASSWNGSSGEVVDSSASGYHGTAVNGALTSNTSPAISGDPGTCSYGAFDDAGGSNGDYVEISGFPNLTTDFTMTSWVRTEDRTRAGQRIFADDQSDSQGYAVSIGDPGTGRIRFYSRGVSPVNMDTGAVINNNTWYFIAAVADITNKQRTLYTYASDGTLLDTTEASYTGTWGIDSGPATLGGETISGETGNRFKGNIDEVRMYTGVLSQSYLNSILTETHPCGAGLLSHLAFEQTAWSGAGVTIDDTSGNGNAGVSVGAAGSHAAGYFCKGAMIPDNSDYATIEAVNSQQDINGSMGNNGTIMLWYRAEQDWNGSGDRILLDASTSIFGSSGDKYFLLSKLNDSRLRFSLEDSTDSDFDLYTGVNTITAGTWVHLAVTWDMPNNEMKIFVNGSESATQTISSNGVLGEVGPVYFGDNSSTYEIVSGRSAYGRLDEIRLYDNVLDSSEIATAMGDSHTCTSCTLGSFALTQPSVGLACPSARSSIGIQAICADGSTQKTDYIGTIDLASDENANSDFYAASSGGSTISSITLDGSESGAASVYLFHKNENPDLRVVASDSAASVSSIASSGIDFRTSGFVASTPANFTCGASGALTLTAFGQTENTSGTCSVLTGFGGNKALKVWTDININPSESPSVKDTGLPRNMSFNGSSIGDSQPGSSNAVANFSAGIANVSLAYLDVGEILGINVAHDDAPYDGSVPEISALTAAPISQSFTVYPAAIEVSADSANATCTGATETLLGQCSILGAAGSNFSISTQALCSDSPGSLAPSYRGRVDLSHQLIAPSAGVPGSLSVTQIEFDGTEAVAGIVATNNQNISEVGVFTLTVSPAAAYFGEDIRTYSDSSSNIGRFTPDHFIVTTNDGDLSNTCSGSFSYIGQAISYATTPSALVIAENSGNQTTQNYTQSDFMKLSPANIVRSFSSADNTQRNKDDSAFMSVVSDMIQGSGSVVAGANPGELIYTFDAFDTFTYSKDINSEIGDFSGSLTVNATTFKDSDDVTVLVNSAWTPTATSATPIRYGRWMMQNAFGPETAALAMPGYMEYLDGAGNYTINTADNCTSLSATAASGTVGVGEITDIIVGGGTSDLTYSVPLSNGLANFVFTAPEAGNIGSVDIDVSLLAFPWLRYDWNGDGALQDHAGGTASFGQYRGHDKIIYWREMTP